jgi:putative nucleotidyltransferase with HDIG domain
MNQLPRAAHRYVTAVIAIGVTLFAVCLPQAKFDQPVLFLALLVLSSMSASLKVYLPLTTSGSTMSVSYAVDFASLLLLGPHSTMLVAAGSAFSQCHLNSKERNPLYRTLFSVASLVITVQGTGLAFHLLGGGANADMSLAVLARPLVGAATVYFLLNTGLVATAIALSTRTPIVSTWHNNFLWSAPSYFVGAGSAALAAWFVGHAGYWVAPLTFAPLYLTYRTYKVYMGRIEDEQRHVQQTSDLHLATIEALARAIDAKDQTTQMHIRRVQVYAASLARTLGLSDADIQGVKTAALLHDIGKLAVPEHILSKPGPLTQEEFQKIRIHPQVGAEIIAAVPFPYPVAPLILSHHERWDGKGYPQGLAGEDIPLGARILTIVDYYDAVTTERPDHKALNHDSAIGLLMHE